jgi:hypothetical protein
LYLNSIHPWGSFTSKNPSFLSILCVQDDKAFESQWKAASRLFSFKYKQDFNAARRFPQMIPDSLSS